MVLGWLIESKKLTAKRQKIELYNRFGFHKWFRHVQNGRAQRLGGGTNSVFIKGHF
jgi:hypothetical protein